MNTVGCVIFGLLPWALGGLGPALKPGHAGVQGLKRVSFFPMLVLEFWELLSMTPPVDPLKPEEVGGAFREMSASDLGLGAAGPSWSYFLQGHRQGL